MTRSTLPLAASLVLLSCAAGRPTLPSELARTVGRTAGRESSSPQRMAYHEAGHTLVALRLGLPVYEVRTSDRDGYANIGRGPATPEQWAMVLMAGYLAERRVAPPGLTVLEAGAGHDWAAIRRLGLSDEALGALYARTDALLRDPAVWVSVGSLAHKLERD